MDAPIAEICHRTIWRVIKEEVYTLAVVLVVEALLANSM